MVKLFLDVDNKVGSYRIVPFQMVWERCKSSLRSDYPQVREYRKDRDNSYHSGFLTMAFLQEKSVSEAYF